MRIKRYKFLSKKYHQLKREQNQLIGEVFNSLFVPLYRKEKIKECDDYCDKHNKSRGPGYDNKAPKSSNEQALRQTVKKAKDLKKRIARHDLSERGIIPENEKVSGITQIGKKQPSSRISSETINKFKSFNQEK